MTEKEEAIYTTIKNFIERNNYSPTVRELCIILGYKSTKSVYYYLQILKNKNIINYQVHKKRSISIFVPEKKTINNNKPFKFLLNSSDVIIQIKNNYFKENSICYGDYLIINTIKKIKNNNLGLFLINNKYRVMRYKNIDNYYILEDKETLILYTVKLIGVVEQVYRFIK